MELIWRSSGIFTLMEIEQTKRRKTRKPSFSFERRANRQGFKMVFDDDGIMVTRLAKSHRCILRDDSQYIPLWRRRWRQGEQHSGSSRHIQFNQTRVLCQNHQNHSDSVLDEFTSTHLLTLTPFETGCRRPQYLTLPRYVWSQGTKPCRRNSRHLEKSSSRVGGL